MEIRVQLSPLVFEHQCEYNSQWEVMCSIVAEFVSTVLPKPIIATDRLLCETLYEQFQWSLDRQKGRRNPSANWNSFVDHVTP